MEFWDLYDKERTKTENIIKRGDSFPPNLYRTVIHVAIINSCGKMLIQQRQSDKSSWADMWDFTVGGHVVSGETSSEGAEREVKEEVGIDIDFTGIRPSLTINFNSGFDDIYILRRDIDLSDIVLQTEEVKAVRWAEHDEILKMIDEGTFIPYHKNLVSLVFDMKDYMGAHLKNNKNYQVF